MDLELAGRVVLVVGGTGLVGSAVVERLRSEGATVISASRSRDADIAFNALSDESVNDAFAQIIDGRGRLDGLVVAAAPPRHAMDFTKRADPTAVIEAINEKAIVFLRLANAALRVMTRASYGRIVGVNGQGTMLTGSVAATARNVVLEAAAKNLADEYADDGITVNLVSPGLVTETPASMVTHGQSGESTPADTANLIAFLLSPLSGAISGESIAVGHKLRGYAF